MSAFVILIIVLQLYLYVALFTKINKTSHVQY